MGSVAYRNSPKGRLTRRLIQDRWYDRHMSWLRSLKTGPCSDCHQKFVPDAMEWDHVRGEKIGHIGNLTSKKAVLVEIAKCDLVCANCHALRTAVRRELQTKEYRIRKGRPYKVFSRINEYQVEAMRTANDLKDALPYLTMGLIGETGEIADLVKKVFRGTYTIDEARDRILEESGDVVWYLAVLANHLGATLSEVMTMNEKKLQSRYPNGFVAKRQDSERPTGG